MAVIRIAGDNTSNGRTRAMANLQEITRAMAIEQWQLQVITPAMAKVNY